MFHYYITAIFIINQWKSLYSTSTSGNIVITVCITLAAKIPANILNYCTPA